jgi:hypothetical protein
MAITFTRGGGFGGFTTLGQGGQRSNNDDGAQRQMLRRTPLRSGGYDQSTPVLFNPAGQGQVFFNPAQTKSTYSVTKRQDAVNPEPDFTGYGRNGPIFYNPSPTPSATPVQNAGLFHTPATLPSHSSPPDNNGGGLGNINDDIPPADPNYDPRFPSWNPGAVVQVNPNGNRTSPFGAGIVPGIYGDLWAGEANPYGQIFEGYMNGMPVFTGVTPSGAYPSSISNPSGIASNTRGGGNTGGTGQTYSDGPSGFAGLFGQPVGMAAPSQASLGSMFAYARMI